jgi:ABC-type molybdate transport system substrate-binding protein
MHRVILERGIAGLRDVGLIAIVAATSFGAWFVLFGPTSGQAAADDFVAAPTTEMNANLINEAQQVNQSLDFLTHAVGPCTNSCEISEVAADRWEMIRLRCIKLDSYAAATRGPKAAADLFSELSAVCSRTTATLAAGTPADDASGQAAARAAQGRLAAVLAAAQVAP